MPAWLVGNLASAQQSSFTLELSLDKVRRFEQFRSKHVFVSVSPDERLESKDRRSVFLKKLGSVGTSKVTRRKIELG